MKAQRTFVPSDRKGLTAILAAATMAVMMFSASAQAEVVTPHSVTPQVITPHAVDPPPEPPKAEPAPAPSSPPPVESGSEPVQVAGSQNAPSHRRSAETRVAPRSGPDPRLVAANLNWENMTEEEKGNFLASLSDEQTYDFFELNRPDKRVPVDPSGLAGPVVDPPPTPTEDDSGKTWIDSVTDAVSGIIREWERWLRPE